MSISRIEPTQRVPVRTASFALFTLGFRPFFLMAGVAAAALLGMWVASYVGWVSPHFAYEPATWHAHEMIFGYTTAVIAGFLLTAVRNWTGLWTPDGIPLALLALVWMAGRVAPFLSGSLPAWTIALIDLAFLPALALSLAPALLKKGGQNLLVLPILAAFWAANLLAHLQALGRAPFAEKAGLYCGVYMVVLLMAFIGGRVIPLFTARALGNEEPRRRPAVERLSLASVVVLAAWAPFHPGSLPAGAIFATAAVAHAARMWDWYDARVWSRPLLWVLHVGYAWIVFGLLLDALAVLGLVSPQLALHALTTGGIGGLTLGMMARVALGHTGRPLEASRPTVVAFVLVNAAAFTRVVLPAITPDEGYVPLIAVAGSLWATAFFLFVAVYLPILAGPRVDEVAGDVATFRTFRGPS